MSHKQQGRALKDSFSEAKLPRVPLATVDRL